MEQQPAGGALSLSLRKLSLFLERQPLLRSSSPNAANSLTVCLETCLLAHSLASSAALAPAKRAC